MAAAPRLTLPATLLGRVTTTSHCQTHPAGLVVGGRRGEGGHHFSIEMLSVASETQFQEQLQTKEVC